MRGVGSPEQRVVNLRQPDMADLALGDEFGHSADRFLNLRGLWPPAGTVRTFPFARARDQNTKVHKGASRHTL
jgi:hypothetical protein